MTERLVTDFGTLTSVADQLQSASGLLTPSLLLPGSSFLGSASVEAALADATRIHMMRTQVLVGVLDVQQAGVRQAVTDLVAADAALASQVAP